MKGKKKQGAWQCLPKERELPLSGALFDLGTFTICLVIAKVKDEVALSVNTFQNKGIGDVKWNQVFFVLEIDQISFSCFNKNLDTKNAKGDEPWPLLNQHASVNTFNLN